MKFINKMRKKEKGFTLVEIIVVLVILAIIAAFTIPAMLGFVSDAQSKAEIAEARLAYVAAQSVATEMMATGSTETATKAAIEASTTGRMKTMLENDAPGTITGVVVSSNGNVTDLVYSGDKGIYTFDNGKITITVS